MRLKAIVLGVALVFAETSCSAQLATATVDAPSLQRKAYELKSLYAAAERISLVYLTRPRCTEPVTVMLCSQQAIADTMTSYRDMARSGVNGAELATRSMTNNTTIMKAAVDGASIAVDTFRQIAETYGGK